MALRFSHGKSLKSYVYMYQRFSDCNGREHNIRLVAAFCIWFEGAILGSKVAATRHVLQIIKIAIFQEVNENYEFSTIRLIDAFCSLLENDPKWQLPRGFLFFEKLQIWSIFDKHHELQHCWRQQNAATRQVFIRPRHHSLMVQSQPRQNYALFFGIL